MTAAAMCNFSIGFTLMVLIFYRAGDIQAAINSPTGQPYIKIVLYATQSDSGTAVLTAYIILALLSCATDVVTTSSRQLFSFARDRGVPFSEKLSRVSGRNSVPMRAVICTVLSAILLSLVLIGSSLAFNVIASLFGFALLGSYLVSVSTLVYRRLCGHKLPQRAFSLGRLGLLINIATILFDLFAFTMMLFPPAPKPAPENMNWALIIFIGVVAFAMMFYKARAKHVFQSPGRKAFSEEGIEIS